MGSDRIESKYSMGDLDTWVLFNKGGGGDELWGRWIARGGAYPMLICYQKFYVLKYNICLVYIEGGVGLRSWYMDLENLYTFTTISPILIILSV